MQGHIVTIRGYSGLWLIIGLAPEHRLYLISLDGEGVTMTASRCDVTARTDDYTISIKTFIFNDERIGV